MNLERGVLIPFQGYQVHCKVYGEGEPIICIHGLNLDHSMFKTLKVNEVLDNKTVFAVDLPGYGKSDFIPNADFRLINKLIKTLVTYFGLKQFELCGFCLGGIFALDFCIRNSQYVSKLYLIETMIYLPWWMNACLVPFFKKIYQIVFKKRLFLQMCRLQVFKKFEIDNDNWQMAKNWNQEVNSFYIQMMKEYGKKDHLKRSEQVVCETRIITAQNTFKEIKKTCSDLQKNIHNTKIILLKEKGHFVY
ncbi:MAG: alpha/beta hydrolase fold protein [Bacillales bacterium]|jgi:pimeloyl-ACP methyl ester carboxylesterase|nr:alpha/beta hydrolase fold protein [Bacillales bacterium]